MTRILLLICGWLSVLLGVIGIVLPVLPTTPFLLLASACFMRSSPKFHAWLTNHPSLGPIIYNWQTQRAVEPKVKQRGYLVIGASAIFSISMMPIVWGKFALGCLFICVFFGFSRLKVLPQAKLD